MAKLLALLIIFITFLDGKDYFNKNLQLVTQDKLLLNFIIKNNINALSFAVMKKNKLVHSKYYEYSNKQIQIKPNNYKRFRIASISKPFTSTAIMQLVENKKLNLTDKLFGGKCLKFHQNKKSCLKYQKGILENDYQTKYGNSIIPNNSKIYDIEIIHLLEHTVGTWNKIKGYAGDPMAYKEKLPHKELIKFILQKTHNKKPSNIKKNKVWLIPQADTKFLYSNFGYSLLGRVIEKISGQTYAEYVEQNILSPLNITTMKLAGGGKKKEEVIYFRNSKKPPYPDYVVKRYDSHGGWTATASDLVKFGIQLNENIYPVKNKIGLTKSSIKLLKTPSSQQAHKKRYAKGFSLYSKNGSIWGHNGKLPGSLAYLRCNSNNNICYSVILNTDIDKKTASNLKKLIRNIAYNHF